MTRHVAARRSSQMVVRSTDSTEAFDRRIEAAIDRRLNQRFLDSGGDDQISAGTCDQDPTDGASISTDELVDRRIDRRVEELIDRRVDAIVTRRLGGIESFLYEIHAQLHAFNARMAEIEATCERIRAQVAELEARVDRLEAFYQPNRRRLLLTAISRIHDSARFSCIDDGGGVGGGPDVDSHGVVLRVDSHPERADCQHLDLVKWLEGWVPGSGHSSAIASLIADPSNIVRSRYEFTASTLEAAVVFRPAHPLRQEHLDAIAQVFPILFGKSIEEVRREAGL